MADLLLPVGERRMSSWAQHQRRSPRSTEPGTDFYCPIGTPVLAPADGYIYGYGESIGPATGRWVGINFDNGMSFRTLHLKRVDRKSGRVKRGEVIGISGASGYGEEDFSGNPATGGAHTHSTLWPTHDHIYGYRPNGTPYTIDIMNYIGGTAAGGQEPITPAPQKEEEEEMKPFVAMLPNGRWALILPQGNGKPRAVTLQGNAGDRAVALYGQPIPFDQAVSRDSLALAVDGV